MFLNICFEIKQRKTNCCFKIHTISSQLYVSYCNFWIFVISYYNFWIFVISYLHCNHMATTRVKRNSFHPRHLAFHPFHRSLVTRDTLTTRVKRNSFHPCHLAFHFAHARKWRSCSPNCHTRPCLQTLIAEMSASHDEKVIRVKGSKGWKGWKGWKRWKGRGEGVKGWKGWKGWEGWKGWKGK